MLNGQYFQKKLNDKYSGEIFGRLRRSILGNDSMQFGFLDSLQRWLATMVNLKISARSRGEEKLQYLKDGLWRQLVIIVELKSGGGCKLLRSSTTDAENITGDKVKIMEKNRRVVEVEAMDLVLSECLCLWVCQSL